MVDAVVERIGAAGTSCGVMAKYIRLEIAQAKSAPLFQNQHYFDVAILTDWLTMLAAQEHT